MKKFLALSLIAVMTAGVLAGCSSKTEEKPADEKKEETTDGETTADGETYIVATDTAFPPFEFTDANGDFVGIDVDIINAIAEDPVLQSTFSHSALTQLFLLFSQDRLMVSSQAAQSQMQEKKLSISQSLTTQQTLL